ncbi:prepilin-type N-terminal cleavage/methylation domain-containing protein [Campylobacter taeniopygiae]
MNKNAFSLLEIILSIIILSIVFISLSKLFFYFQ